MGAAESILGPENAEEEVMRRATLVRNRSKTISSDEKILSLRGLILGSPETGKTSLLRRLSGIEFHSIEEVPESITIPWMRRKGNGKVEDTITLDITKSSTIPSSEDENPIDFILLMIDPRRQETLDYAERILLDLSIGEQKSQDPSPSTLHPPMSFCLLFNFRDALPTPTPSSLPNLDHLTDILTSPYTQIVSLQCSMKNCFGLKPLHEFMAVPYLAKKRFLLRKKMDSMEREIKSERLKFQKQQDYHEFLELLNSTKKKKPKVPIATSPAPDRQLQHPKPPQKKIQMIEKEPKMDTRHDVKPSLTPLPQDEKHKNLPEINVNKEPMQPTEQTRRQIISAAVNKEEELRSFIPSPQSIQAPQTIKNAITPSYVIPIVDQKKQKSALDDFFSSDEEEDDAGPAHHQIVTMRKNVVYNDDDSSDDDEDDFYYDDEGRRHEHVS